MTHVTLRAEFEELIDPYAPVGQVGTGFDFTEGPIWHPVDQYLLFSDMPADVRRRWDSKRGVVEARRPSNKCNGMTYDEELNLIVCEHATSSLVRERPDGRHLPSTDREQRGEVARFFCDAHLVLTWRHGPTPRSVAIPDRHRGLVRSVAKQGDPTA